MEIFLRNISLFHSPATQLSITSLVQTEPEPAQLVSLIRLSVVTRYDLTCTGICLGGIIKSDIVISLT